MEEREPESPRLLLTISEIAALTGYSQRQLRIFVTLGKLKNVSCDRTIRIARAEVRRLMEGRLRAA